MTKEEPPQQPPQKPADESPPPFEPDPRLITYIEKGRRPRDKK